MARVRVSFDRGTLRVDGDVATLSDLVRFDERTGYHRASGHRYAELIRRARERGFEVDDAIVSARQGRPTPTVPPPLRPYQAQALAAFDRFGQRGTIALPTGSGKTRLACAAMAQSGESTVVLVPTRVLLEQWLSVLRGQFGAPIGAVGDGMKRLARITVMTFESAYRCLDRWGGAFGMLVVDEAHHFASGVRAEALEMCPAPIRLGLTATPPAPGSAGAERLRELIGPLVFQLEIADLAGRDLAALDIVHLPVALTPPERVAYERDIEAFTRLRRELRRANPDADWVTCVRTIACMPGGADVLATMRRAAALAAFPEAKRRAVHALLARHRGDRTLLFTAAAEHAYTIAEAELIPVITAEVARRERDAILAAFRERRVRAVCSARVLNEGVDVPDANVAIIVGGALGAREHVQRVGRILRPGVNKRAVAYDLVTLDTVDETRVRARRRVLAARTPAPRRFA
jgi:superfamily II DNA or RNA helicase